MCFGGGNSDPYAKARVELPKPAEHPDVVPVSETPEPTAETPQDKPARRSVSATTGLNIPTV